MNKIVLFLLATLSMSCNSKIDEKDQIKQTDIEFSNYSVENGMNKAFIKYAADEAVLLKSKRLPIIGTSKIKEYLSGIDDSEFSLVWKPDFADVSESGDLGYSYGFWKLKNKQDSLIEEGTYLTIWKKQKDGSWKYVLDTGNSGLK